MGVFSFDFHLVNSGFNEAANPHEASLCDGAGAAQRVNLVLGFDGPQLMHQARQALVIVKRVESLSILDKPRIAGLDLNDRALVFVGVEINMVGFAHQAME